MNHLSTATYAINILQLSTQVVLPRGSGGEPPGWAVCLLIGSPEAGLGLVDCVWTVCSLQPPCVNHGAFFLVWLFLYFYPFYFCIVLYYPNTLYVLLVVCHINQLFSVIVEYFYSNLYFVLSLKNIVEVKTFRMFYHMLPRIYLLYWLIIQLIYSEGIDQWNVFSNPS